ncbi:MAG TPA: hypothetical protein VMA35_11310 [Candidatus Sulfopaludibacter sp.]|nr:hypothetical protein [Candidatus Sulfopaludibacter sp.]
MLTIINFVPGVLFVSGLVGVGKFPGLYATFPVGATLYGLFLISRMLEKEVEAFDAEQRAHENPPVPDNHSEPAETLHGHEHHEPMRA